VVAGCDGRQRCFFCLIPSLVPAWSFRSLAECRSKHSYKRSPSHTDVASRKLRQDVESFWERSFVSACEETSGAQLRKLHAGTFLSLFARGALLMRAKEKASESRVITCVLSTYFFLEAIVCECFRGEKRSATVKALCWSIFFHTEYNLETEMCDVISFLYLHHSKSSANGNRPNVPPVCMKSTREVRGALSTIPLKALAV
ncbi:MAG: hypothetical protein PWP09_1652, partial [Thermotogota bacterium]|nr:hypothetical protein [Thermotogota bacterium]